MKKIPYADLAKFNGVKFIENCYSRLLHRQADPSGKSYYLGRLRTGEDKAVIIGNILRSREGRQVGEDVKGIWLRYYAQKLEALPVIGSFVAAFAVLAHPKLYLLAIRRAESQRDERGATIVEEQASTFEQHVPAFLNTMLSVHALMRETQRGNILKDTVLATHTNEISRLDTKLGARINLIEQSVAACSQSWQEVQPLLEPIRNLIVSVPVSVRANTRALAEIESQLSSLLSQFESHRSELDSSLKVINTELQQARDSYAQTSTQLDTVYRTLDYLSNRVEFARREVLFETKYGSSAFAEKLDATPKILDENAMQQARTEGLKLNVGCGHIPMVGYINIDRRALPGVAVRAEAHDMPFNDGEVDEIYSAHLLEHFPQEQLRRQILPYWRKLLKPGGKLVAVVPDTEFMLREYHKGTYPYEYLREVIFGGQDYDGDFHYNMFMPEQLSMLLREAGFQEIQWPVRGRVNGHCFEMLVSATGHIIQGGKATEI